MTRRGLERLPRAQLRAARRTAMRLRGGGLVIAVGESERRRRDFEAALAEEGVRVASTVLDVQTDPWEQIIVAGKNDATPCVAWNQRDIELLASSLNLGRERITELSRGLLLWIGGTDALETLPLLAPDLWAYRVSVEWILSSIDFVVRDSSDSASEVGIAEIERELEVLPELDARRIHLLNLALIEEVRSDRLDRALAYYDEARRIWAAASPREASARKPGMLYGEVLLAWRFGRWSEALATAGIEVSPPPEPASPSASGLAVRVLVARGNYAGADRVLSSLIELADSKSAGVRSVATAHRAVLGAHLGRTGDVESRVRDGAEAVHWATRAATTTGIELAKALAARARLRTLEELQHLFLRHVAGVALDAAGTIADVVEAFLALGLHVDAYRLLDEVHGNEDLSPRRKLLVRVLRARCLIRGGATSLGASEAWEALDAYRDFVRSAEPAFVAEPALVALDLAVRDLIPLSPASAEADELRLWGLEFARSAEAVAVTQRQYDWAQELRALAAKLLCALDRHAEARELLEQNLAWSELNEGPSRICQRGLELARLDVARGEPHQALVEVDLARQALEQAPEEYQPRSVWRELLLEHAQILAAAGQPASARALQTEARERMSAAGLLAEELIVLHALAEPLPGDSPEALDIREPAAADALALAAPSGLMYEEARALANFALVHAERGRRAPAQKMLAEARWLTEDLIYGPIREHIDRVTAAVEAALAKLDV